MASKHPPSNDKHSEQIALQEKGPKNLKSKYAVATIAGILTGVVASLKAGFCGVFFFFVFLVLVLIVGFESRDKKLFYILIFAFLTRALLVVLRSAGIPLPGSGADSVIFDRYGWNFTRYFLWHSTKYVTLNHYSYKIYTKFIAYVYFVTGHSPISVRMINAFLGTLVVANIYRLTLTLRDNRKSARFAAFIAAVFPSLVLYSSIITRDIVALFFVSLSMDFLLKWVNTNKIYCIPWSFLFYIVAVLLHGGMILMLPTFVFLLGWLLVSRKLHYNVFGFASVIIGGIVFLKWHSFLLRKLAYISRFSIPKLSIYITNLLSMASRGGAGYLRGFYPHSFLDMIWQTPIRMVYFMFSPFPWMFHKPSDLFGLLDAGLYILIVLLVALNGKIREIRRKNSLAFYLIFISAVSLWVGFSWGTSNYGTAIRHRIFVLWLMLPFATDGFVKFNEK